MNTINKKISNIGVRAKSLGKDVSKVDFKQLKLLDQELKAAMLQLQYDRIDERLDRDDKIRLYSKTGSMIPVSKA